MKKRVVIVHCWDGYPEYCWYQWVKADLEKDDYEVTVPAFPETGLPKLETWLPKLKEVIGEPDENLILVGHSVGVITILRYLEKLPRGKKIGGAVFVAGFTNDLNMKELSNFFTTPINFEKIKSSAGKVFAIHSDNDPYVDVKHGKIFEEKLGAKLIIIPGAKHFSGPVDNEESCTELPEVVESVTRI